MTVGDLKTHFSDVLKELEQGNRVEVLYGRAKKPVAIMSPYSELKERPLGFLEGIAHVEFHDNWEITQDELDDWLEPL
jgi:antitoxin (DNA-binding transcriptional repressor) of toxin-antitoxin stability system